MDAVTNHDASAPVTAPLADLASDVGVATHFTSIDGEKVTTSRETILKILAALDVDLGPNPGDPSNDDIDEARRAWADARWRRLLPPVVVSTSGEYKEVIVHVPDGTDVSVTAVLDDGSEWPLAQVEHNVPPREVDGTLLGEAAFAVPENLPLGWHVLRAVNGDATAECELAVTPGRLSTADAFVDDPATGVMAQLYSVRSERSWGIGDLTTLGDLASVAARAGGADFVLINPLHAAEPCPPVEDSPYLPTTRRYSNPLYIRVEMIPEFSYLDEADAAELRELAAGFRELNRSADEIDRNPIYAAKLRALHAIHGIPLSEVRRADYERFLNEQGRGILDFARWCADRDIDMRRAARDEGEHTDLIVPLGAHEDEADLHDELVDFHCWLQWILDEQLRDAQRAATDAGMRIGIMADLAVGVHPGGSDARNLAEWMAPDASVGAPPDGYNQQGQDWSQPPWNPHKLAEASYMPWRDMLRTVLRHSGGIRVDHVLGLFRLWMMPRMEPSSHGTYVHFDHEAMVGILALEAELAGAVVIGEDLGTFEPWVQEYLARRGILGTSILWFESDGEGAPKSPSNYRRLCLSSVTTHDLPPTAGYLDGVHVELRDRLGLFTTDAAEEEERDLKWITTTLAAVDDAGCFDELVDSDGEAISGRDWSSLTRADLRESGPLVVGLHRYLARTPSALTCMALVDMVGDRRPQNQPGTTHDQYPNWCVPLTDGEGRALLVSDLTDLPLFGAVAEASRRD
ncbi:4-alpha-glucanotransferase [uncultured Corynebacterium sp.]|uniref:4-alpha-glucanotransferase n=1 Tax=uncultured Corynebacterium sp. TaxID=159447 RepID=UPI0025D53000|nr:4-alpha-glucanotransferase [uncultured Corynebacterium sp.]